MRSVCISLTKIVVCSSQEIRNNLIIFQAYDIRKADHSAPTQCASVMVSIFKMCKQSGFINVETFNSDNFCYL